MVRVLLVAAALGAAAVGLAPVAVADPPYANCDEAAADGAFNMTPGHPGYHPALDRDRDGIACET